MALNCTAPNKSNHDTRGLRRGPRPQSRIFRISGSHKSRYSQKLSARPVPIVLSRRDEAIDVSYARIRVPTGFPKAINPGSRKSCRRDRYQSSCLAETKRLTYHTPGSEYRRVICDLAKSRISESHKSRQSQKLSARPVPIVLSHRDEAIDVSYARIRVPTRNLPFYVTHGCHVFTILDMLLDTFANYTFQA
ncbi:hypothetical protein DdX_02970 [Ditylenchus destructor]|uniref:Uncharacterized protein n=1 Tax=Ditylenchus destructor TaxID=166010 RepID=A0AAD4NIV0_9BILA|nr:hypothetical protein DdX_02970 [Ditylenchus destructor]